VKLSATPAHLPEFIEPMKAKLVGSMPTGDWIYEIKFDGYRALALRGGSENAHTIAEPKGSGQQIPRSEGFNCRTQYSGRDYRRRDRGAGRNGPLVLPVIAIIRHGPREAANSFLCV
jgi:hypothetical protein